MSRGKTTARAAVSLVLLAGFHVYALAVAAAVLGVGVLVTWSFGGLLSLKVLLLTGGIALAVFAGLVAALRRVTLDGDGKELSRADAPALWDLVDDTARRVGTRTADELRLTDEVNAGVIEEARLLGLKAGHRLIVIGVPLLAGMSAAELRSVLAHEFGHYAHVHTRLAAISHRCRMAIDHVLDNLRRRAPYVAWVFTPYVALYLAVQSAVSRGQELEADIASARIAGKEAAAGSFATMHMLDLAWSRFFTEEVECGIPHGLLPRGVWTGFGDYLDELGSELRGLAAETPHPEPGAFSSHPPVPERLARIARLGGKPEVHDTGAARNLLPGRLWTSAALDALAVEPGDRTVLDWPEFGARVYLAYQRHLAESGYRRIARVTGTASLSSMLDQYGDPERARRWYREYIDFPEAVIGAIVLTAAHDSGAIEVRHAWREVRLTRADGSDFDHEDYFERFTEALDDLGPTGAERLRALLAELGVDPRKAVGAGTRTDARTAVYTGLESNVSFDGKPHDMAVTDEGIVLHPCPKSGEGARERLLTYVREFRPQEMAALPGARWIAYEEIAAAKVLRRAPFKCRLTLEDGRAHVLAFAFLSETVGDPTAHLFGRIALLVRRPARRAD